MSEILTILTVNFANQFEIEANIALSHHLNHSDAEIRWIVADNSIEEIPFVSKPSMKNVEVFDGLPKSVVPRMSHHHGEALNLLIKRAGTDFVLVLDPDFYIFNANWIRHSIDFMKREDLSFFGSTWHSVLHNWKWYDFPNCHFLMMNMKKLESESLDFRPGFLNPAFTDPVTGSRDTGYRLRHKFKNDPHHRNAIVEGSDTPNWIREIFLDCEIEDTKIARMEYYKKGNLIDAVHLRRTQSLIQIFDQYSNVRRALVRISKEFSSNSL